MKLVLIGGHSRNIGKTSLVEAIIRTLPDRHWTAVKITQFGHGVCSVNGDACGCAVDEHRYSISAECHTDTGTDTARYLAAGAARSLWVRTKQGELVTALPALKQELATDQYVIAESNSLRRFWPPALYLQLLDPHVTDFKASARQFLDLSDALLIVKRAGEEVDLNSWPDVSLARTHAKPYFFVDPAQRYINNDVIDFIKTRI